MTTVHATARLQFHSKFTLDHAVPLVPYLKGLGISHVYASPLLKSRAGSTHGYDIVDHGTIDAEVGGEAALRRLVGALRAEGMGLIIDIVPNHMGVGGADNAWWLDVLEWGRASPYASYFDIDWDPSDPALKGKLLAPFLGASYGECLSAGELCLRFDQSDGRFFVDYGGNRFPIHPRDYPIILRHAGDPFAEVAQTLSHLATPPTQAGTAHPTSAAGREAARRHAAQARQALRGIAAAHPLAAALAAFSTQTEGGAARLHRLLERQSYRLAWWRAAADEINWRRFFDVNGLAGMRVDQPEVFNAEHALILRLYAEGLIDGVRVDHVDGLADPRGYCRKLRRRLDAEAHHRPADLPDEPAIIWVEKILAPGERLPRDWMTDGTTGYDFMNDVSALLHDPAGEAPLAALWHTLTGRPEDFADEACAARRQILRESLSSELWATATALHRLARRNLDTRDYTLTAIRRALEEILVHFVAYRIYAGIAGISDVDAQVLTRAIAGARRTLRSADLPLLDLLQRWLSGDGLRQVPAGAQRNEWLRAMVRFQQLSAPTAAKSVEDTAFYRYGRLLSRNEVGSEPSHFCLSPAAFHTLCAGRQRYYPRALLATATHDHKRGEDNRARLAVLSEIPDEWEAALARWTRLNAPLKRDIDSVLAPDPADEIMLYQTMIGAWPYGLSPDDGPGMERFIARLHEWQEKALREGKRHSEWAMPNEAYESACKSFASALLDPTRPTRVAHDIAALVDRIAPAGAINGLAQTVLRMTTPGIPDLYQGSEFWDLSLVDPDNRRPVDYDARIAALTDTATPGELLGAWQDGRVKQTVISRTLGLRARRPKIFGLGAYERLELSGAQAEHGFAFLRRHRTGAAIVVISRLAAGFTGAESQPLIASADWGETGLLLPRHYSGRQATDVLGSMSDSGALRLASSVPLGALLARLPVAVLEIT
jgi:(1->4)-alpha-D-glucan 1-alpha-D-glucosylmutase